MKLYKPKPYKTTLIYGIYEISGSIFDDFSDCIFHPRLGYSYKPKVLKSTGNMRVMKRNNVSAGLHIIGIRRMVCDGNHDSDLYGAGVRAAGVA